MSGIFDTTLTMLQRGMDLSLTRQTALHANVANLDTPGYTPRDLDFEGALSEAMRVGEASELSLIERPDRAAGADGNRVDLDIQMARIAQNATLYQAGSQATSRKLAMLRYVLSEGA